MASVMSGGVDWLLLPFDLYVEIFQYLTAGERASARVACRAFRALLDHPCLWHDRTVRLRELHRYDARTWRTLQGRRVSRVELARAAAKDLRRLTAGLPDVTAVRLTGPPRAGALAPLAALARLRDVWLDDCTRLSGAELLRDVAPFSGRLTHLTLGNLTSFGDDDLRQLARLQNLEALSLRRCLKSSGGFSISGPALQYVLFRLPKLRSLALYAAGLSSDGLSLAFTPPCQDPACNAEGDLPCIKSLALENLGLTHSLSWPLSDEALDQLASVRTLLVNSCYLFRRRDLPIREVTAIFQRLPNVVHLDLGSTNCKNAVLEHVPASLQSLDLRDCYSISGAGLQFLWERAGTSLRHLNLSLCNRVSHQPLAVLHKLFPNLESLDLSSCRGVTEGVLSSLACLPRLRMLCLRAVPDLPDDALRRFRTLTHNRVLLTLPREKECNHQMYGLRGRDRLLLRIGFTTFRDLLVRGPSSPLARRLHTLTW
ncbi:uncharacterized protein LOC116943275 isoform X2 [Petromyzon marinus]|uniref:uncharacterized protein LOC116943275 isoform X2 n=1 Tax=Petromyzon marinus TaxID=7757 RepID=UPI003F6E450A